MIKCIALALITSVAFANVAEEVMIKVRIGNDFNTEKVKITDSLGKTYYLKTKYFPSSFQFKQRKEFTIEVPEEGIANLKITK
jgi:hypothetical protein